MTGFLPRQSRGAALALAVAALLAGCPIPSATPGVDLFPCATAADCAPYACGPQGFCLLADAGLEPDLCLVDGGLPEYAACRHSEDCACPQACYALGDGGVCQTPCGSQADCKAWEICALADGGGGACYDLVDGG